MSRPPSLATRIVLAMLLVWAFSVAVAAADDADSTEAPTTSPDAEAAAAQPAPNETPPAEPLTPEEERRRDLTEAHGAEIAEAILAREVLREMTIEQVLAARGEPQRKEVIPPDAELWHYPDGEVALSGGKVSYVSLAVPAPPAASPEQPATQLPSTASGEPPTPTNSPATQVPAPPIAVGDTYVYESKAVGSAASQPGATLVTRRTVTAVGRRIAMSSLSLSSRNGKPRTLYFDGEWNLLSVRNPSGSGLDYTPPLQYYDFPLFPGKTWEQATTERNTKTGATREHVLSGTVRGWEQVSVPAGTFRGLKVELRTELFDPRTGERVAGTDTSWYAALKHNLASPALVRSRRTWREVDFAKGG
jgi:hypothetical protein